MLRLSLNSLCHHKQPNIVKKLHSINFTGTLQSLFESYITGGKQYRRLGKNTTMMKSGALQGPFSELYIYILYVNNFYLYKF